MNRENLRWPFWFAISCPSLHENPALIQRIPPTIRLFRLVAYYVRQCGLGNFPWKTGDVACPVTEAGTEAMDGSVFNLHPTQDAFRRHIGQRLLGLLTGKYEFAAAEVPQSFEDRNGAIGQGHSMFPTSFHP